jgi:hypothetical protein
MCTVVMVELTGESWKGAFRTSCLRVKDQGSTKILVL